MQTGYHKKGLCVDIVTGIVWGLAVCVFVWAILLKGENRLINREYVNLKKQYVYVHSECTRLRTENIRLRGGT